MIGDTISHYRVLDQLGAGGMGVVYRAHDEQLKRDVALKVLSPKILSDDGARSRFQSRSQHSTQVKPIIPGNTPITVEPLQTGPVDGHRGPKTPPKM